MGIEQVMKTSEQPDKQVKGKQAGLGCIEEKKLEKTGREAPDIAGLVELDKAYHASKLIKLLKVMDPFSKCEKGIIALVDEYKKYFDSLRERLGDFPSCERYLAKIKKHEEFLETIKNIIKINNPKVAAEKLRKDEKQAETTKEYSQKERLPHEQEILNNKCKLLIFKYCREFCKDIDRSIQEEMHRIYENHLSEISNRLEHIQELKEIIILDKNSKDLIRKLYSHRNAVGRLFCEIEYEGLLYVSGFIKDNSVQERYEALKKKRDQIEKDTAYVILCKTEKELEMIEDLKGRIPNSIHKYKLSNELYGHRNRVKGLFSEIEKNIISYQSEAIKKNGVLGEYKQLKQKSLELEKEIIRTL